MLDFEFQSPTRLILKRGAVDLAGSEVRKYSDTVLLTHYGDDFIYKSGLRDRVVRSLEAAGLRWFELPGVQPNPLLSLVYQGIELCRENDVGFILALGGGSVIDTAKAIAAGTYYDGDVWDLYLGKDSFDRALPVGTIMTIPATGSEGSNGSVITNGETKLKRDIMSDVIRPAFTLMDPELTFTLPRSQTVNGIVDMGSHVMERYFSPMEPANDLTDRLAEAIMVSVIENGRRVLEKPDDYDARADLMVSSIVAHNGLVGIGRMQDWASHAMGAPLSGVYNIPHGATLSVLIPAWMQYVYRNNIARFRQFAVRVMGVSPDEDEIRAAEEGIRRLHAFYGEIGAPLTMEQIGIHDRSMYASMAKAACNGGTIGCVRPLGEEDIIKIYELAEGRTEDQL